MKKYKYTPNPFFPLYGISALLQQEGNKQPLPHLNFRLVVIGLFLISHISCLTSIHAQSENALTRSGNKDFKKEKYSEAEINYRKALEKKNNMPEAVFNLGDAVYQQKRFEEAAKQFQLSGQTHPDPNVRAKAYHNLGNTYMAEQKYEDAVKAYKQSLKLNAKDADTKYNLAYANAMLQQQQQQQDNKDDKQNQDKKENKDKQQENKDKNNDQKDNQQQQADGDKKEEQQKQQAQPKLSKAEAEKLLQALQNEEQKANQKMQKANVKPVNVKVEKDW